MDSPTKSSRRGSASHQSTTTPDRKDEAWLRIIALETGMLIYDYNLSTGQIHWDGAIEELTGFSAREFSKVDIRRWEQLIHAEDRPGALQTLAEAAQHLQSYNVEYRFQKKNKAFLFVEDHGVFLADENGQAERMIGTMMDITRRKQAELGYKGIFENAAVGIFQSTPDGRFLSVNPAMAAIYGYASPDEMIESIHDIVQQLYVNPQDRSRFGRALKKDGVVEGFIDQNYRKDGSRIWVSTNARAVYDNRRKLAYYEGFVQDITAWIEAEEARRSSEERFRLFMHHFPGLAYIKDSHTRILFANQGFQKLLGIDPASMQGKGNRDIFPGEFAEKITVDDQQVLTSGQEKTIEERFAGRVWFTHKFALQQSGQPPLLGGITLDISGHKQAEESLQASEEQFRTLFENAPVGIGVADREGNLLLFNPALLEPGGYAAEDFREMGNVAALYANPAQMHAVRGQFTKHGSVKEAQVAFLRKDGSTYTALLSLNPIRFRDQDCIQAIVEDITKRERAEKALRNSEQELKSIIRVAPVGIGVVVERVIVAANDRLCEMTGYSREELLDQSARLLYPTDEDYNYVGQEKYRQIAEGGTGTVEVLWRRKDGTIIQVLLSSTPLDLANPSRGVTFTALDITERKMAEAAIRESEEKYRLLVEHLPEAITVHRGGTIDFANQTALKLMGAEGPEEIIGQPFIQFVHPDYREMVVARMRKAMTTGRPLPATQEKLIRLDGTPLDVDVIGLPITYGGEPSILAIIRDITDSLLSQEALRARTSELEVLYTISSVLRSTRSVDELLPRLLVEMRQAIQADSGAVVLLGYERDSFTITLADGLLAPSTGAKFNLNESRCAEVLRSRAPVVTTEGITDPDRMSRLVSREALGPKAIVPLITETEILGMLIAQRRVEAPAFTEQEVRLLAALGEMVGNALQRTRLYDQALERLAHVQSLRNIDLAITASIDPHMTLDILLGEINVQLKVDAAAVLLFNPGTLTLEHAAGRGLKIAHIQSVHLGEGLAGRIASERRPLGVPDLALATEQLSQGEIRAAEGFVAYYGAPMIAKGHIIGVLETFHRSPLRVTREWVEFLEAVATQAAIAIDNARLFDGLQRANLDLSLAYDATIEGWSHALELREQETERHSDRVTELTLRLALALGITDEDLVHIRRGALLHDIGKMGIPDSILLKPGKLTEEEWAIMHRHPQLAFDMLSPITYLKPALDIPYRHHEKWDGNGYPNGLAGENIPLAARIFAVIDVFDALTSQRPYRDAWSKEDTLEYIKNHSGSHFDPRVAELFLNSGLHL
ncbi:MAG: PAS domain S-box protein [Anaerolineales bacterium]|nr:PAS domain S-box protein [Anaerolineales bacterium]